jgi:hypothetical protein
MLLEVGDGFLRLIQLHVEDGEVVERFGAQVAQLLLLRGVVHHLVELLQAVT